MLPAFFARSPATTGVGGAYHRHGNPLANRQGAGGSPAPFPTQPQCHSARGRRWGSKLQPMSRGRALHARLSQWGGGHEPHEDPSSNQEGVLRRGSPWFLVLDGQRGWILSCRWSLVLRQLERGTHRSMLLVSGRRCCCPGRISTRLISSWYARLVKDRTRREGLSFLLGVCVSVCGRWALSISSKLFSAFAVNYFPFFTWFNSALCVPLPANYK